MVYQDICSNTGIAMIYSIENNSDGNDSDGNSSNGNDSDGSRNNGNDSDGENSNNENYSDEENNDGNDNDANCNGDEENNDGNDIDANCNSDEENNTASDQEECNDFTENINDATGDGCESSDDAEETDCTEERLDDCVGMDNNHCDNSSGDNEVAERVVSLHELQSPCKDKNVIVNNTNKSGNNSHDKSTSNVNQNLKTKKRKGKGNWGSHGNAKDMNDKQLSGNKEQNASNNKKEEKKQFNSQQHQPQEKNSRSSNKSDQNNSSNNNNRNNRKKNKNSYNNNKHDNNNNKHDNSSSNYSKSKSANNSCSKNSNTDNSNSGYNSNSKNSSKNSYGNNSSSSWSNNSSNKNKNDNNNNNKSNNNNNNNNNNANNKNNNNNNNNKNNNGNNNNNQGGKKGSDEKEHLKAFNQIRSLVTHFVNRRAKFCAVDSLVLKLHYRLSMIIYLVIFFIIQYNWFARDSIYCVSLYNAANELNSHFKYVCLSYPFVEEPESGGRRYLLFYRWMPYYFVLLSCVYYIPRLLAKMAEKPELKKLMTDLEASQQRPSGQNQSSQNQQRNNGFSRDNDMQKSLSYMLDNHGTHSFLYIFLILNHVIALAIDYAAVLFFNFILSERFLGLLYNSFPFERDPANHTDYISRTFPPFVKCVIDESKLIASGRIEPMACHLTLMELYEKIFLMLWVWTYLIAVLAGLSILELFFMILPPFNRFFIHVHSSSKGVCKLQKKVLKLCSFGDLYVLHLMKKYWSERKFIRMLSEFVDSCDEELQEIIIEREPQICNSKHSKSNPSLEDTHWKMQHRNQYSMNEALSQASWLSSAPTCPDLDVLDYPVAMKASTSASQPKNGIPRSVQFDSVY